MKKTKETEEDIFRFIFLILVFASIIFMIKLSPLLKSGLPSPDYYNQDFEEVRITKVISEKIEPDAVIDGFYKGRQELEIEVLTGKYAGKKFKTVNQMDFTHTVYAKEGMTVIAGIRESDDGPRVWIYNNKRTTSLYILVGLFFGLLILFGRKQGFYAIVALLFTTVMLIFILVPLIFRGYSVVLTSSLCAMIALIVSFVLISGFEKKTLVAIAGTMCGIVTAGMISAIFSKLSNISIVNLDKGSEIAYVALDYRIKVKGVMYASILIASLGAVMDVAMSISSSMGEIKKLNPDISFKKLFESGMNIGKDIMGTMANTLVLAFLGGSFSLVLLLWGYNMSYTQTGNLPFIAVQVVEGISGSIGVILTVPFTALLSCMFYQRKNK